MIRLSSTLRFTIIWSSLFFSCSSDPDPIVDCAELTLSLDVVENIKPSSCTSLDGSISLNTMGFTEPLEYSLNNGAPNSTGQFTNLSSGDYNVMVQDVNGCSLETLVVLDPPISTVSLSNIISTVSGCDEGNATVEIIANGDSNLFYSLNGSSFQESAIFENVSAGTYNVTVSDDVCRTSREHRVLSGISFASDIKSIIDANCAVSGCHVPGTGRVNFAVFTNVQNEADEIKTRTQSGNMPQGDRSITQEQIDLISCWVDDGALDN